jgi:drug/metabolite transporter (DMT)-like permease
MWLLFSVLAGGFFTASSLLQRYHLRKQKDVWTFAFFFSLIGSIVSLPFMLAEPKLPTSLGPWYLAAVVGLFIVGNNLLVFRASGLIEASLMNALTKLRLVWVFVFGILFLHSHFSRQKLAGTILAVFAGWVILRNFRKPESATGTSLVLAATLFNAGIVILSKYLLGSFNAVSLTFFASFLPATIFIFVLMPQKITRIRQLFQDDWRIVILACSLGAFANLSLNAALSLHDATSVLVINEVFLVFVLVGEHIYLKEREHAWIKFASVLLAVFGAILIEISH